MTTRLELKGYLKSASKDITNEVKSWAGSAWASFGKVLKSQIGLPIDEQDTQASMLEWSRESNTKLIFA